LGFGMQFLKYRYRIFRLESGWKFFQFPDSRAKNASGLFRELLFVRSVVDDELNNGQNESDDERAGRVALDENLYQVQYSVLEMSRLALGVDVYYKLGAAGGG
jgi:hypothetical protein